MRHGNLSRSIEMVRTNSQWLTDIAAARRLCGRAVESSTTSSDLPDPRHYPAAREKNDPVEQRCQQEFFCM
jgi:hypothetical protein